LPTTQGKKYPNQGIFHGKSAFKMGKNSGKLGEKSFARPLIV